MNSSAYIASLHQKIELKDREVKELKSELWGLIALRNKLLNEKEQKEQQIKAEQQANMDKDELLNDRIKVIKEQQKQIEGLNIYINQLEKALPFEVFNQIKKSIRNVQSDEM